MGYTKLFGRMLNKAAVAVGSHELSREIAEAKLLNAKALINQIKSAGILSSIQDAEFKVFSQFGDDGIIQYLIHQIDIPKNSQVFIEFGVQDYLESNTRFLLMNNNWRGLILDGSQENICQIQAMPDYWRYDLTAVAAFIDIDNINGLFSQYGFEGQVGLLSIDIDGNDYWVWETITVVNPFIVVVEYNATFGSEHAVTIPYDAKFERSKAHFSNLYWGTSLRALCVLAENKGYVFVGCNDAGNNAYFVKREKLGQLQPVSCENGFVLSKFREARDMKGDLSYIPSTQRLATIRDLPVYNVETDQTISIGELYGC